MTRTIITVIILAVILSACAPTEAPPVEVTRIVTETEQIEVTRVVEVTKDVEVTRVVELLELVEVEVTRPVIVTVTPEPLPETPAVSVMTAEDVLNVLVDSGLPVGGNIIYTAETDPNNMLGRPGGYTSKVNFHDTRLSIEYQDEFDTGDGGSIEVFPDVEAAMLRAEYLTAIGAAFPAFAEYHIQSGNILLRLSRRLTPDEITAYEVAMENLD
jgi:hypothetical protein